ncbi:hypothetical protein Hbl1158_08210 [Halobaculum sp. CBA1158]|uniref:hypothetical protein n=1 Tax=Halobaculum sp. CBA1158 TaxID=2904243 RepID=UPI001F354900|nr:hypothetical protein [Halobaculum sp. CBA1158]UIO98544.1 hypothetical protein Hbl1158_08210 [Halobaculum sp. CBA1158]
MDDEREDGDPRERTGLPEPSDPSELPESSGFPELPDATGPSRPTDGRTDDANADVPDGATPSDLPADVESALTQLVESARVAVREGRTAEALAAVDTAHTVAENKLPPGDRRDRIRHGCERVADLAAADPTVAAEYLDAVRRRLP